MSTTPAAPRCGCRDRVGGVLFLLLAKPDSHPSSRPAGPLLPAHRRQAAAGSTITLTLEEVRRALDGDNISPDQGNVASLFPLNSRFQLPVQLRPLAAGEFVVRALPEALAQRQQR